jgi:DNA primase
MENHWVDFKAVKQNVSIEQVLNRYGVKLKKSGKELRGRCPIHQGEGSETFHANIEKNAFHCFSCHAKGNVLDFVAAKEQCSVRDAALKLQEWFQLVTATAGSERSDTPDKPPETSRLELELATEEAGERGAINKPLSFRLSGIDHGHPYLSERGIDRETAEYFGVGFFSGKGSMTGRIVIPIENERGELVAYAGRSIGGSAPKYKLPAGFKKSQVLYNLCRAAEETDGLVVLVEGFFDCIRVTQAEYPCVALMGCSLSELQEMHLVTHFRQALLLLDGDDAGRNGAGDIAARLVPKMWVRTMNLTDGKQPDQLSLSELQELLNGLR